MQDQDGTSEGTATGANATDEIQDTLKLTNGVVLRLRNPSPMAVAAALQSVGDDEPKPPKVWIKDKDREEENPADPEYLAAKRIWLATAGQRALRALLPTGTALESKPDDVVGPDDEDYADLMASMGIEPGAGRFTRYVQWVLYVAAGGTDDFQKLSMLLMRRAGVSEEDVAEAEATFRGDTSGPADQTAPPDGGAGHRD